jgi:hypothetical protein
MGFWELDHQLFDVHHLMVLCYHLQHPGLYSPEGLEGAKRLLVDFVVKGISPQEVRRRDAHALDSGARKTRIEATADRRGEYAHPVRWQMTAADVVAAGMENYYQSVRAWANSVLESLRVSANIAPA